MKSLSDRHLLRIFCASIFSTISVSFHSIGQAESAIETGARNALLVLRVSRPVKPGDQYQVSVFQDGKAEYVGYANVKTTGTVRYRLSKITIDKIVARIRSADIGSVSSSEPILAVSRANEVLTLNLDGKSKTLYFRGGRARHEQEFLRDMMVLVDTEKYRCPTEERIDMGATIGKIRACDYSIELLKLSIDQTK